MWIHFHKDFLSNKNTIYDDNIPQQVLSQSHQNYTFQGTFILLIRQNQNTNLFFSWLHDHPSPPLTNSLFSPVMLQCQKRWASLWAQSEQARIK